MEKPQKKPRVLFIGPYPPPYSGPELGMKLFLESSLKEVFDIKFLKTNFRKTNVNKGRIDHKSILAFFKFIGQLIFMLIKHKPKLAYYPITATQTGWLGRDIWCLFICRLFGVKTVIHLRGGHFKINFQTFNPLVKLMIKIVCRFVSLALVQAACLKREFLGLVSEDKIKVLYNAIDTTYYENPDLKKYNRNMILFLGHLEKAKGYCDAIRAIPIVAEEFPQIKFCFAGTMIRGPQRNIRFNQTDGTPLDYEDPLHFHDQISHSSCKNNYLYLGVVSGREKLEVLKNANIFILPSYSEGFSRAVLEALAMGKPVISTPVGANKEILLNGENGFLITPGDHRALAAKIIFLLQNIPLRDRISEINYKTTRERFDIKIISNQLSDYFQNLMYNEKSLK